METQYEVNDNTIMWFGKFKGTKMANVPAKYLLWLWGEDGNGLDISNGALKKYIKKNLEILKKEQFQ